MALNTFKCNCLPPLHFKVLKVNLYLRHDSFRVVTVHVIRPIPTFTVVSSWLAAVDRGDRPQTN